MKQIVLFICLFIFGLGSIYGETILFKSGKTIEGKIIEKTETSIKISTDTVPSGLTYYLEDVERIGSGGVFPLPDEAVVLPLQEEKKSSVVSAGEKPSAAASSEESGVSLGQELVSFKLGIQKIGDSILDFQFPGNDDALYVFNIGDWQGKRQAGSTKLVIKLYDKRKLPIEEGESMCVPENVKSFGNIRFATTKKTINNVVYFSAVLIECAEKSTSGLNEDKPEVQFARSVEAAAKESKEAYFALYADGPGYNPDMADTIMYMSLNAMCTGGGKIMSVKPLGGKTAEAFKAICARPYEVLFEQHALGGQAALFISIGKVKGDWRILKDTKKDKRDQ